MKYLTGVSNELTRDAADTYLYGRLGVMLGPGTYGGPGTKIDYSPHISDYCCWALDNGCFSNKGQFDGDRWLDRLSYLVENIEHAHERCLFAVAPDVFDPVRVAGDMAATIVRSLPFFDRIRERGVPAALVFQDGAAEMDLSEIPWDAFDVAFLGGSDEFKLGYLHSRGRTYTYDRTSERTLCWARMIAACIEHEKEIHVGRVSSEVRVQLAREIHAYSCDGTYLKFRGTTRGLPEIDQWLSRELKRGYTDKITVA